MKKTKIVILFVCINLASAIGLFYLIDTKQNCSYVKLIHNINYTDIKEVSDMDIYRYDLEHIEYISNTDSETSEEFPDYFSLIYISGWEASLINNSYIGEAVGIFLHSENNNYYIETYKQKRNDLAKFDNKDIEPGFFTYVVPSSICPDTYQIGIIIKSNNIKKVIWTPQSITIHT